MPLDTIEDIVTEGVRLQAIIDRDLAKVHSAASKLTKVTEAGVKLGMVQGIAAKAIIAAARSCQGRVADAAHAFAMLHDDQTAACVAAGADLGSVTKAGGIVIGGVHTEGGGR